jgi:hypothetical protein
MYTKLHIELGGLCMLVQRTSQDEKGLFVLMPEMKMIGHAHCQYMVTGVKDDAAGRKPKLTRIGGNVIDLRWIAANTKGADLRKNEYAQMSAYSGAIVDPRFFDVRTITGPLAASVVLPLSVTEEKGGFRTAAMCAEDPPGKDCCGKSMPLVGRVLFTVDIDETAVRNLTSVGILGTPLEVDDKGHLKVWFLNARPKDLGLQRYHHEPGEVADHLPVYYDLLSNVILKPNIRVCEHQDGYDDHPDFTSCAKGKIDQWPPEKNKKKSDPELFFIDPFNCTIGIGCETQPC